MLSVSQGLYLFRFFHAGKYHAESVVGKGLVCYAPLFRVVHIGKTDQTPAYKTLGNAQKVSCTCGGSLCRPYKTYSQISPFPQDFEHDRGRVLSRKEFVGFIYHQHDFTPLKGGGHHGHEQVRVIGNGDGLPADKGSLHFPYRSTVPPVWSIVGRIDKTTAPPMYRKGCHYLAEYRRLSCPRRARQTYAEGFSTA